MAELADAQDLGSCAARRMGSTPITRTSSEIPLPACAESCAGRGIFPLSARTRSAGLRAMIHFLDFCLNARVERDIIGDRLFN